jgi:cell division protein FtsB
MRMAKRKARRAGSRGRTKRKRRGGVLQGVLIALSVALVLLTIGMLGREDGIARLMNLRRDFTQASLRIDDAEARIAEREAEARALKSDPVAIEGAIRGDLGLARPGEWVVRERESTNPRNP